MVMVSCWLMARARMSVEPPGAHGTITDCVTLHSTRVGAGAQQQPAPGIALAAACREAPFGPDIAHHHMVAQRPQGIDFPGSET